jgi:anthranilate synthase component 1
VDPAVERALVRAQQRLDEWVEKLRTPRSLYAPRRTGPEMDEIEFVSGFTKTGL